MDAMEYAAGLREFADWVENNAELLDGSMSSGVSLLSNDPISIWGSSGETVAALARAFGRAEKNYDSDSLFYMRRSFGALPVEVYAGRETVCRKVVIGTKTVTREMPDPDAPKVTVTETEEIVEWECSPLLAKAVA